MGKHSKIVSRGRGRHRAPSTAGRTAARVVASGAIAALPVSAASPAFASSPRVETVANVTVSAGGFDHDAIIKCESGGDARAQNSSSTASGLYQFINGTWKAYGGSTARAKDASVSEQRRVAERAFAAEGYTPWNASKSCWGGKTSASGSKNAVTEKRATPKQSSQRVVKERVAKKDVETVTPKRATPKRAKVATGKSIASHHTVKSGETLSQIAEHTTGTWSDLYSRNRETIGSNPNLILPGQVLKVEK